MFPSLFVPVANETDTFFDAYECTSRTELDRLFALNDAAICGENEIDGFLAKLADLHHVVLRREPGFVTLCKPDLEFRFPLTRLADDMLAAARKQFLAHVGRLGALESSLVASLAHELNKKNQIILKLAASIAQDYLGNTLEQDEAILQSDEIQRLFLQTGTLRSSLGSSFKQIKDETVSKFKQSDMSSAQALKNLFISHAELEPARPSKRRKPNVQTTVPDTSPRKRLRDHSYNFPIKQRRTR
ncbi:hypothetical protein KL928_000207 [Ogataea angusta]|uniref:Uncharacterized protein n=1 Tax=Pichia angusta TaxID=870730 RepID=A0AAN6DKX5_PICAN|nr:uncharacterized protein KL928_000207 [Ogataea angusta]KAG7821732.1 hypothetical protein KL928_000207 [Ogataea angusta]